ncbi:hypothetical protein [Bradyrhizobium sp. S3.5.5]|uniref:hypothetical protein n=1 Tax=Bradyrhizobium sp. S3.5.5 TaxID=3156430 RepID=UPI003399701B
MKSDARMTAVKGSAEPPRNSHKIDEDPQAAWQLFNANWLIIAVMGSLLALGLTSTNLPRTDRVWHNAGDRGGTARCLLSSSADQG